MTQRPKSMTLSQNSGALAVIEVGSFIAGPFCGQLLADLGADVIKIEPPESGDVMRQWGAVQLDGTTLSGPAGRVSAQGTIDLPGAALDVDLAIDPSPPAGTTAALPQVGLRLTGAADLPRRTPELAAAARWLGRCCRRNYRLRSACPGP